MLCKALSGVRGKSRHNVYRRHFEFDQRRISYPNFFSLSCRLEKGPPFITMFSTHRGSMSTSRLPTIVGQTGVPLGLAHGLGGRHGSAELGNRSRGRVQRSRERNTEADARVRSGPAGPQERIEWMDALNDCKTRITALETNNRNIAQTVGSNTEKINTLAADIQAYKNYLNCIILLMNTHLNILISRLSRR